LKRFSSLIFFIALFYACTKHPSKDAITTTNVFYDKAYELRDNNKKDSAFFYFDKAKDLFLQQRDSLGVGKCLVNMAIISTDKGDYYGGQEISLNAISHFDENNEKEYAYINSNYNNLGIATTRLANYEKAIKFYDLAIKFTKDATSITLYLNNKASAYQELKQYQQALKIYDQILASPTKNKEEYAMILNNSSFTRWLQNPNYNATPTLLKALRIRKKENDLFGQNSSYAALADYYAIKRPDSALIFAKQMYQVAIKINMVEDQLQALQKLIKLSPEKESKNYFKIYNKLDDSVETAKNLTENRFVLLKYEYEKNKSDNLILEKVKTENKLVLYGTLLTFLVIFSYALFWYKKRKQHIELEAKNSIKENQLRTSKKIHDVVANKIYNVISEIENKRELDKDNLLDKLDHIYHTSRDISYEITDSQQGKKFSQQLSEMFYTYVADPPEVKITGNEDEIWTGVSSNNKGEIFIVLQELMTNMKKHSKATEVNIEFHEQDHIMSIRYHDNGTGLPKKLIYNNGLRNTETRIKNISGTITFETTDKLGLEILISFPVN